MLELIKTMEVLKCVKHCSTSPACGKATHRLECAVPLVCSYRFRLVSHEVERRDGMAEYADSQVLVSTEWADLHRNDHNVTVVEIDEDLETYKNGHIPGAISWNRGTDLADKLRRDILGPSDLETLLSQSGVSNNSIIVLCGDNRNRYALWAYWQLKT